MGGEGSGIHTQEAVTTLRSAGVRKGNDGDTRAQRGSWNIPEWHWSCGGYICCQNHGADPELGVGEEIS